MRKKTTWRGILGLVVAMALAAGALSPAAPARASAPSFHGQSAVPLPYGPYTCKSGFVWREALIGDYVCVQIGPGLPDIRRESADENALADFRREPNGGAYGFYTCKPTFVWRETRPSDRVCVTTSSRARARVNNENGIHGLADPSATPQRSGVYLSEQYVLWEGVRLSVSGSFSPYSKVTFYQHDSNPPNGVALTSFGTHDTDASGQLTYRDAGGSKMIYRFVCDTRIPRRKSTIVAVNHADGLVYTVGKATNTWCTPL